MEPLQVWNFFNAHFAVLGAVMVVVGIATALPIRLVGRGSEHVRISWSRRTTGIVFCVLGLFLVAHGLGLFALCE